MAIDETLARWTAYSGDRDLASFARELLAARKVVAAARSVSAAIENGETLSSEAHEAMELLTQLRAYDAATEEKQ